MRYELLLINVSRDLNGYSTCFRDSIGQYLIASYLGMNDYKAFVFTGNVTECSVVIEKEIEKNKVPVIGFYAAADNIRIVKHMVAWVKKKHSNVKTIIGGPQAIALNFDFFEETNNDFAIIGEGERPVYFLLRCIIDKTYCLEDVPSLVFRRQNENCLTFNSCDDALIKKLDEIPYPLMENSLRNNLRQGEIVGIITGRGCPYKCTFCYEGANSKNVRLRSIDNVMKEIDYVKLINHRLKYISIYDDTFTLNNARIEQFCEEIEKRDLKWFCEGHISFVLNNPKILKKMIENGLECIQFGIESGSNKVLNAYNKNTNYDMILQAVRICKESGIHGVTGNFIIGGAFETEETIELSKKLVEELILSARGIIELYVVYFAPYPNTKIVNNPDDFDMIFDFKAEKYNLNTMRSPVVSTKNLSIKNIYDKKREFEEFVQDTYKKASLKPMKKDVIQGLFNDKGRIYINPTWEKYYLSQPHIVTFIEHYTCKEQDFDLNGYIIRTFEDVVLENDIMFSEVGEFRGIEKDVLLNATGIYTAKEMTVMFNISEKELEDIYYELNNKCFVYISKY